MTNPNEPLEIDLRAAALLMNPQEIRYLVDTYYGMQDFRIQASNEKRAQAKSGEPGATVLWLAGDFQKKENRIKSALDVWSRAQPAGKWMHEITGIGPVLAAGILANIDIEKAPNPAHIWAFAGLDPTQSWKKGEKRPWNARLKVLCWKLGESFVKVSNNDNDFYGHVYAKRKEYEQAKNEACDYRAQAEASLAAKKFGKDTEARKWYEQGKLPPARIHLRAERYAVKLFLSHLWQVSWELKTGKAPGQPYAIAVLGHSGYIAPPNWPMAA